MRVLLTGAAGFIGTHVGRELVTGGHDVVGVDVLLDLAHAPDSQPPPGVRRVDLRDPAQVRPALKGVDVVCHQAAMVGNGVDVSDLPHYVAHNDLATAVLLAEMAAAGVGRLVLASSMVVYGEGAYACPTHGPTQPPPRSEAELAAGRFDPGCPACGQSLTWRQVDEDSPLRPRSGYAATKVAQEHLAAAWATLTGGSVVALRYHNVYGPGMPADTPYAGVAAIFRSALERGEAPRVFEDGAQTRDFVHVADVARANAAAVEVDPRPGLRAYNVCSGRPRTVAEMAAAIATARGGQAPVVTGTYRMADVRHVVASPERAATELGFRAQVPPETGLAELSEAPLRPSGRKR